MTTILSGIECIKINGITIFQQNPIGIQDNIQIKEIIIEPSEVILTKEG